MFCEPARMQGRFGPADERLAVDWHRRGMSLETVRRAILVGSARKSMSLLDHPGGEPVRSLRYFARLLEEVRTDSSRTPTGSTLSSTSAIASGSGRKGLSKGPEVLDQIWNRQIRPEGIGGPPPQRRQKGRRGDDDDLVLRYNCRRR